MHGITSGPYQCSTNIQGGTWVYNIDMNSGIKKHIS